MSRDAALPVDYTGVAIRWRPFCLKYLAIIRVSAASNLAYLKEVVFRAILLLLLMYIIGTLWQTTFAQHTSSILAGFTINTMVWYLAAAETIALSLPQLSRRIDQEVRNGEVAYLLGRPCSYLLYNYANYLGERLVRLALNGVVAAAVALIFVGPPHINLMGVVAWPLMVLLAISIEFACYFTIGLLAFWMEQTQLFALVFSQMTLVFGGVLVPLQIFSQPLRAIVQFLPFSSILYSPSITLVHFTAGGFAALILLQTGTFLGTGLFALILYRHVLRHVNINGG